MNLDDSKQMRPESAANNRGNCWALHLEKWRNLIKGFGLGEPPYFNYVILCQNCSSVISSLVGAVSSFRFSVAVVFSFRSQEKVRRIAAQPEITPMAYAFSWRNALAPSKNKRDDMGQNIFLAPTYLSILAVPLSCPPRPALINSGHINPRPKTRNYPVWDFRFFESFGIHCK